MQILRPVAIAVLLGAWFAPASQAPALAQTCTCGGVGIRTETPPPPLPEYDQPPIPDDGYLWTPGYWAWNSYDYYWIPGTWVEPPQQGLLWTPGYWGYVDGVYAFNAGYWDAHVGYYGGVFYGYGYGGEGYEGGRWENGAFFYNKTVNNITNAHITNIYSKTVVINNTTNHSSFNGPGGATAKPTMEELTLARGQHVQATPLQIAHARTASMKSDLFASTNHGKPSIAATVKPAAFTGPGVVKAKAAGVQQSLTPSGEGLPGADNKNGLQKNDLKPALSNSQTLQPKEEKLQPKEDEPLPRGDNKNFDDAHKLGPNRTRTDEPAVDHKLPGFGSDKKLPANPTATKALGGESVEKHFAKPLQQPIVAKPIAQPFKQAPPPILLKPAPESHQVQHVSPPPPHALAKPKCGVPGAPKCP
jgi:WXXGXW repeat (2 copies)